MSNAPWDVLIGFTTRYLEFDYGEPHCVHQEIEIRAHEQDGKAGVAFRRMVDEKPYGIFVAYGSLRHRVIEAIKWLSLVPPVLTQG